VGEKETLEDVARMFGVSKEEIIEANYLDPSARLQKGMLLSLNVRGDVMARIAKRRAAARLEKQEDEELMQGYAMASPPPEKRPRPVRPEKHAPVPREGK
jgi:hypothetical protein